jgi:thiamine-monophosphate kinase
MGAKPVGVLVALALPEAWRPHLDAITDGIGDAAAAADALIIGGDMSGGTDLTVTVTVLGATRDVLFRTGARPGDAIYVTGRLGGPLKALRAFVEGSTPAEADRARFAHPVPRIAEAMWLSNAGAAAAIDISDGLGPDLRHLASASRVALRIDLDELPVVEGATPLEAASSGEEYELIVAAQPALDTAKFRKRFDLELTRIGTVEQGNPGVRMFMGGEEVAVPEGYSHFRG